MSSPSITIYYDVVSPYAYLGFEILHRYAPFWNVPIILKPFFVGGVMNTTKNTPPGLIPSKGKYMLESDLPSLSQYYSIPLNPPTSFVKHTMFQALKPMRIVQAVALYKPEKLEAVSRSFWKRLWEEDGDIVTTEGFIHVFKMAGVTDESSQQQLIKAAASDEIKHALTKNTEEAVSLGAFGAPFFVVNTPDGKQKTVFGSDRFHIIAMFLNKPYLGAHPNQHPPVNTSQPQSKL